MPSKNLQAALIGGLFIGVLSALPIVGLFNCVCCLWVVSGGILTAYLMQNASPTAIAVGDGAVGGLLAGLVGAVVHTILSIPLGLLMGPFQRRMVERWLESAPDVPDSLRVFMRPGEFGAAGLGAGIMIGFLLFLVIGAIFATIGGMIGAAIFSRNKPTVVPAPPPPQA